MEKGLNKFRLDEWKAKRGISSNKILASLVGVSPNTVSGWRQGQNLTTVHQNALCHVLDCQWEDLEGPLPKAQAPMGRYTQMEMVPV